MERELAQSIGEQTMAQLRRALIAILATLAAEEAAAPEMPAEPPAQRSSKARKTVR
jgi:hypothetical protein